MSANREFIDALLAELATVVGAMAGTPAMVTLGTPTEGRHVIARIEADAPCTGYVEVALEETSAGELAARVTGAEGPAPAATVIDAVQEIFVQALSGLASQPVVRNARLKVADVRIAEPLPATGEPLARVIAGQDLSLALTVGGEIVFAGTAEAPAPAAKRPASAPAAPAEDEMRSDRLDVILDIDLPVVVRFGRTELPLRTLSRLGPGSVIDLGRSPDDPVELLVSNQVVARGEVVIVSGNYGIRIVDVVSPAERIRTMEA